MYSNQSNFIPSSINAQMLIYSHKHENSKDSFAKIGAFRIVQFASIAKDSFRRSRCCCDTQKFLSSTFRQGKRFLFFHYPKTGVLNPWRGSWSFVAHGKVQILKGG